MSAGALDRPIDVSARLRELLDRQQAELDALTRAAEERQATLTTMLGRLRSAPSCDRSLQTLEGLDAVRSWIEEASQGAHTEAVAMSPGGKQSAESLAHGRVLDLEVLRRGVRLRGIYLTSATHWPAMRQHVTTLTAAGAEIRTTASLPMRMLLIDDEVALLPLVTGQSSLGALVIRTRATLVALRALFEATWESALRFGEIAPTLGELTQQEQRALEMMAQGARDQDVAQALGVSLRTVRRMMATLSERLGACSRFQAGVKSVQAGWVPR